MRLTTFILTLASLTGFVAGNALQDGATCELNHPGINLAIEEFCKGNDHIMVPSAYADKGKRAGNHIVKIGAESNCDPPQWVPREYCLKQFFEICAHGNGRGKKRFGRNGCQSFHIGKITLAA